jgi:hypothetical protein
MKNTIKTPSGIIIEYSIIHKEKGGEFKNVYFVEFTLYNRIYTYVFEKKYSALKKLVELKNLMK